MTALLALSVWPQTPPGVPFSVIVRQAALPKQPALP
jgi:hypothetical protein